MEKFALIGANDTVATWDGNKLRWAKLKPGEIQATMDRAYQKALASALALTIACLKAREAQQTDKEE